MSSVKNKDNYSAFATFFKSTRSSILQSSGGMETAKFEAKSTVVQKVIEPLVDLGNLLIIDRDPIEGDISDNLLIRARNNAQFLFNKVWELDTKHVDSTIVVELPKPIFRLPREKKSYKDVLLVEADNIMLYACIALTFTQWTFNYSNVKVTIKSSTIQIPEKREKTKWELYAEQKGITKRKKDKKIFDESTKEWKPTYGYRRTNDNTKDWLLEVPEGADPSKDYFAERKDKKKERVAKNEMQRMKNIARQLKTSVKKGPSVDQNIGLGIAPEEKSKSQIRFAVDRAKSATASVGKFQRLVRGEKENIKTGKKRKFEPNEGGGETEKQRALDILTKMKAKKAKIVEEKAASIAGPEKKLVYS
uniref:Ribosome biogenesis regulatory protein n=1 Tax=Heterorhabditis bacteriophora TaxID=37862 RepID=A0A1I7XCJ7_HETBA